ncbi:PaaI family thioesterase [Burkholderia ambifaria]|uniref:PaaI family thioesterase n=1 Tax=Burkholderia ambifaria TaxID=152480 RepID=UPI000F8078E6|nr:PaaI family thioesterase [Burkholderia ambifaria]
MENPDREILHSFHRDGCFEPALLTTNPLAIALQTKLLRVDIELGVVELSFRPGEQFLQGANVIQGGIVSAMLDFALGFAALAAVQQSQSVATATLNVSFLRPAKAGTYVARGRLERLGRVMAFTRGALFEPGERPVATATSSLAVVGAI